MSELERAWKAAGGTVRDRRWEKVWASVGPILHDVESHTPEDVKLLENIIEFRIEVVFRKTQWYAVQRAHKDDIADALFDNYKFILDKMVENLDEMIERGLAE